MKTLWWKVRYTICFCQHVGWTSVRLGWESAGHWSHDDYWEGMHPVDACIEDLSYWND